MRVAASGGGGPPSVLDLAVGPRVRQNAARLARAHKQVVLWTETPAVSVRVTVSSGGGLPSATVKCSKVTGALWVYAALLAASMRLVLLALMVEIRFFSRYLGYLSACFGIEIN